MKALLITYDLQPPWDSGLKVYGRGLMHSMQNVVGMKLDTVHDIHDISNSRDYDYVHVVLTGFRPFAKALKTFKQAKIFKHIVTPSIGIRSVLATKTCYAIINRLENRLVKCFSSEFVARSYFINGNRIIPPSIDTSVFVNSDNIRAKKLNEFLEVSPIKYGLDNLKHNSDTLILYSGPLTEDRFPYKKVLTALNGTRSKMLIIGRPTNNGAEAERIEEIISYSRRLNVESKMAVALKLLNEEEKVSLLNLSDVIIQPFTKATQEYVAVDPPIFLLEAMACGKPVITSRAYSFQSFIKNGYNGYTIDWDNSDELKEALLGCQNAELGMNARQTVLQQFSHDSVSQKLKKLYNDYN